MDKKGCDTINKYTIFILLIIGFLASGCETAKGFARGSSDLAYGLGSAVVSTTEGAGKDTDNFFKFLKPADGWIRKNLW